MPNKTTKKTETGCRPAALFGEWLIDAAVGERLREQVARLDLVALAREHQAELAATVEAEAKLEAELIAGGGTGATIERPYTLMPNGVAVFGISGPTTKYTTSFQKVMGGTSTVMTQRAIRTAAADPEVKAGFLHLEDVPGGTLAGAFELRDDIRAFAAKKPFATHATDLCCSAGYLFGSATGGRFTANRTATIGSIGTRATLVDTSKKAEKDGIKYIPVSAGKFKSAGLPGTEITAEQIELAQKRVDELNSLFINSVSEDRKLTPESIRELEARTYLAGEAVERKLIDGVSSYEESLAAFGETIAKKPIDPAPEPRNASMNFLEQMRTLLGLPTTATEAEILARVTEIKTSAPKPADAALLSAHLEIAVEKIDFAVAKGEIAAPFAATLKSACGWKEDGKHVPSPLMLTPAQEFAGKRPADVMLRAFDGATLKDAPKEGEKSPVQPLTRTVPGEDPKKKDDELALASADEAVANYRRERGIAEPAGNGATK